MASKENAERKELHRKIWAIADDVRGAVDGWDFKQYILGILFYRFISEHMADYFDRAEHEAGDLEFRFPVNSTSFSFPRMIARFLIIERFADSS